MQIDELPAGEQTRHPDLDMNQVVGTHDILMLCFDTLRYDVSKEEEAAGRTPVLNSHGGEWEKRHAPGNFTYPSHFAIFAGFLPSPAEPHSLRSRKWLFFPVQAGTGRIPPAGSYPFTEATFVQSLANVGYETICIGGVNFFSKRNELGRVFPGYFTKSYWLPTFGCTAPDSTEKQIDFALKKLENYPEDKRLLWFSRPSGTCCFRERDVFLKDTRQHNTWRFYGEQTRDTILAYAVELTGTEQEKIKGNLYELDYLQHFREVIEKSIPADNYTLIYEHGELTKPAGQYFDGDTDPQLGKFIRFEAQPNDPEALKSLLREQQKKRTPHTQRDFQLHIAALHDRQIEIEARRIVENVKGLGEPDSPEKTHCAVELSPYFVPLATDKDMERLLSMLPYKSLSLSTLEGRHGVYALIDKSERKKEMKQSPPSVRAQLQTEKSPKVPKKTAKSKHHELEV